MAREDINLPGIIVNEPIKVIHDFYSGTNSFIYLLTNKFDFELIYMFLVEQTNKKGVDYIINKIRNNCTIVSLGTSQDSLINAAKLDSKKFVVMKTPNELFDIDDSFFYAGYVIIKKYKFLKSTNFYSPLYFRIAVRTRHQSERVHDD